MDFTMDAEVDEPNLVLLATLWTSDQVGKGSLAPTLLTHLYLQVFVSLVPTKSKIFAQLYLQGWGGVGWG